MSTTPTVLPVDAPPPIPSVSPYPEGIASFYYAGYGIVEAAQYNPALPIGQQVNLNLASKNWQRPEQPGENQLSNRTWNCIVNGVEIPAGVAQTIAQAAAANVFPNGVPDSIIESLSGTPFFTLPAISIPTRPLLPTEKIAPGMPGMWIVTNSAVAGRNPFRRLLSSRLTAPRSSAFWPRNRKSSQRMGFRRYDTLRISPYRAIGRNHHV